MIDWHNIRENSDCIASQQAVQEAIGRLAVKVSADYHDKNPVVLCLMNGGLFVTAELTQLLNFPLRLDYIHASRYRGETTGKKLQWFKLPSFNLANEHVLIIDDIYDEGITLLEVEQKLQEQNPASVSSLVLVDKRHRRKPDGFSVRYVGLTLEDRYLYGCGMDYHGHWRHLSDIYAVKTDNDHEQVRVDNE